ncbi:MAG: outer membrane beta-barrel protein [Deltaproteobacteria bacterium]|nr:outer membrane beta-barrel protein [Deltaproteobacteria bacterium]
MRNGFFYKIQAKISLTSKENLLSFLGIVMKDISKERAPLLSIVLILGILGSFSAQAAEDKLAIKRIAIKSRFKSGLGAGARVGYGFWQGLSVEGDFQYDRLFREGGIADDEGDKNLYSLAAGLRYTVSLLRDDISTYLYFTPGFTFDYTKGARNNFELSYAVGTGMDFNLTERLSIGPLAQFRHIFEDTDIYLMSVGAVFTYIFD